MSLVVDTTIVGAGVIGTAVARRLAQAGRQVVAVEKNPGVTRGENQTSRNSGVIHAGLYYDRDTRPLKARLCPRGNGLLYEYCARKGLPHLACGKLVVAVREEQRPILAMYLERARQNGVPCRLVEGGEAREMAPGVTAVAALFLPTSGIIDPTALVHALYTDASAAGAEFLTSTALTAVVSRPEGLEVTLTYRDGAADTFLTRRLVNCAGLQADETARLVDPASLHRVDPMRGEAACFYRTVRPELDLPPLNVYPTPYQVTLPGGSYWTVGVHLTPTLEPTPGGGFRPGPAITVGPLNFAAKHKEDFAGDLRPLADFHKEVKDFFPVLEVGDLRPYQAGVQARLAGHQDWLFEKSPADPRCLNLLGFDSPGLTSSLAIALEVEGILGAEGD